MVTGPNEAELLIAEGALPDGTVVRLGDRPVGEFQAAMSPVMSFITGFDLQITGGVASTPMKLSFEIPHGLTVAPDAQILVLRQFDFPLPGGGTEKRYSLIEVGKVVGDRITTASPPFCGITSTVQFMFVEATVPLAMASVSVSSSFPGVSTVTIASPSVSLSSYVGGGCNEFAVPVSEAFSGEVHDNTAAGLTTVDFGTPDWPVDQIGTIFFPGPKTDAGPFRLVDNLPAADAEDVPIASSFYLQFSEEVDWTAPVPGCDDHPNDKYCVPVCDVQAPTEHCLCVHATDWPACISGEARAVRDGLGVRSVLEFRPDRRFEFATEWEVDVQGIRPSTMEDMPIDTPAYNLVFRTFDPVVIGSLLLQEEPQDLEVLEDGSIAVAVDPEGEWAETGLAIIDVSDPTAPSVRSQYATRGHANGLTALPGTGGFVLLDASLDHPSRVHIFDSHGVDTGNRRLTASQYAANTGQTIGPVHVAGWPIDSVVAPLVSGDHAVYVATALLGVQVMTATSIRNEDNSTAPGLRAMDSPVALGVLGNNLLVGDMWSLRAYSLDMSVTTMAPDTGIPARYIDTMPGFTVDLNGDGQIAGESSVDARREQFDLALILGTRSLQVGGHTVQRSYLSVVDFFDTPGQLLSQLELPGTGVADQVRGDPVAGLAYVVAKQAVWAVDISNPWEGVGTIDDNGDGRDDRVLGEVLSLDDGGSIELADSSAPGTVPRRIAPLAFIGDPEAKSLRVVGLSPESTADVGLSFIEISGADDQYRVFPGSDAPGGDFDDIVEVSVQLHGGDNVGQTVFWDAADVDDPSSNSAPIDPNGHLGNDNRGDSEFTFTIGHPPDGDDGTFVDETGESAEDGEGIAASVTAADGVASIRFRVTHQPGDNFEIRFSTDRLALMNGEDVGRTPTFTVWRRLHVEHDVMAYSAGVGAPQQIEIQSVRVLGDLTTIHFSPASQAPDDDPDQYRQGLLAFSIPGEEGTTLEVVNSGDGFLRVIGDHSHLTAHLPLSASLADDDIAPIPLLSQCELSNQTPCIQHPAVTFPVDISSEIVGDYTQAVFGAAFVEVVLTEPGSRDDIPFADNIETAGECETIIDEYRDKHSSESYWAAYVVGGFQGPRDTDGDPNDESQTLGQTLTRAIGSPGSVIYLEVCRELSAAATDAGRPETASDAVPFAVVHEVGHQFGFDHDDGERGYIMDYSGVVGYPKLPTASFGPSLIDLLRSGDGPYDGFFY
jgi:hypothetical protein